MSLAATILSTTRPDLESQSLIEGVDDHEHVDSNLEETKTDLHPADCFPSFLRIDNNLEKDIGATEDNAFVEDLNPVEEGELERSHSD